MTNLTGRFTGKKAVFNYSRNHMTTERYRRHDNEIVTVLCEPWVDRGNRFVSVENKFNGIYACLLSELSFDNVPVYA